MDDGCVRVVTLPSNASPDAKGELAASVRTPVRREGAGNSRDLAARLHTAGVGLPPDSPQ